MLVPSLVLIFTISLNRSLSLQHWHQHLLLKTSRQPQSLYNSPLPRRVDHARLQPVDWRMNNQLQQQSLRLASIQSLRMTLPLATVEKNHFDHHSCIRFLLRNFSNLLMKQASYFSEYMICLMYASSSFIVATVSCFCCTDYQISRPTGVYFSQAETQGC
jgi:hypothetical protein